MYVDAEEAGLRDKLEGLVREETWTAWEDAQQTNVLRSSSELFAEIKKSLQRCSKFVSKGPALFQLCTAFQVAPLSFSLVSPSRPSVSSLSVCKASGFRMKHGVPNR